MGIAPENVEAVFNKMKGKFNSDKAAGVDAVIQVNLNGETEAYYWLKIQNGELEMSEGQSDNPSMTLLATVDNFADIINGKSNAMQAFMSGKLKVKGDMTLALKLQPIFDL